MAKKEKEEKPAASWAEKFGSQVMNLGKDKLPDIDVISTRSIALDKATGIGGIPRGRITEIYGAQSGGKTSVCLHTIAEAQSRGLKVLLVDAENTFDPKWARKLGVVVEELILVQPNNGELGLEIVREAVKSREFGLIVIDSVTALIPKAEIEGEVGDNHMGRHPRMMGQGVKLINVDVEKTQTAVVFINQTRMKIGVMFGSPVTTTGGEALKFFASLRLEVAAIEKLKEGEEIIGRRIRVKVVKNKAAAPHKEAEFDFLFTKGIHREAEVFDLALDAGKVTKTGNTYACGEIKLGVGRKQALAALEENPELFEKLRLEVV